MVSGVTDVKNYKLQNKSFYSQPAPLPSQGTKRFSDSPSLRPWPPMYKMNTKSNINGSHQYHPVSTSGKFNFSHGGFYGNGSVYGRNKFNLHGLDRHNNNYSSSASVNLTNIKNAKNYYLVSQPYMKNSLVLPSTPFYSRDENLLMVDKDGSQHNEKGRFRKLRNPTQTPPLRSCACIRSKSMEDVRTEIVTDWTAQNGKEGFNHLGRTRILNGLNKLNGKNNVRRSMDNLLEVDTAYGKPFQVGSLMVRPSRVKNYMYNIYIYVRPSSPIVHIAHQTSVLTLKIAQNKLSENFGW